MTLKIYEPTQIETMPDMARSLKGHIVENNLYTNIQGKNYVHVDGWAFAGAMLGLMPVVTDVQNLSNENEIKWLAKVEVQDRNGRIMGTGFAVCTNKESRKRSFDEYAVLSMAQTRAIGKAYRNIVGWVIKLAGYETTPSEEMGTLATITQSKEAAPEKHYECHECAAAIDEKVAKFSKAKYGKSLCRDHQPKKQTK